MINQTLDCSKLYVGQRIQNQEQLCKLLGVDNLEGDYGEYEQTGLFASYFSFVEDEEGFLIKEIYKGHRGLAEGDHFVSKIEHALLYLLSNQQDTSSLLVPVRALTYMTSQVNRSELSITELMPAALQLLDNEDAQTSYFGDHESSTFAVEEAIFSLRDQALLIYQERLGIVEDGELRSATDQESLKFLKYSYSVVKEMGFKTIDEVYENGLFKEYQDNLKEKLKLDLGIDYAGKLYLFGFNSKDVRERLLQLETRAVNIDSKREF